MADGNPNPASDAVQLSRSLYIGNFDSYWAILGDYMNTDEDPTIEKPSPAVQLVFELCLLIKTLHNGPEYNWPREWFDECYRNAQREQRDGLGH